VRTSLFADSSHHVHDWESCSPFEVVQRNVRPDVLLARHWWRLVVPALELANRQSLPNQSSLSLTVDRLVVNGLQVPLLSCFVGILLCQDDVALFLAFAQVVQLLGIVVQVEELRWVDKRSNVLVLLASDHHDWGDCAFSHVLAEDGMVLVVLTVKCWVQTLAIEIELRVQLPAG
jgi:hypothetical protein